MFLRQRHLGRFPLSFCCVVYDKSVAKIFWTVIGMNSLELLGKFLLGFGAMLLLFGGLLVLIGKLGWTWKPLPGDIVIKRDNFTFIAPITTSLLLSLVLTILLWLLSILRR